MDIEQTAFIGSSKVMLKMLDNMIQTIDARVESVKMQSGMVNMHPVQEASNNDFKLE